MHRADRVEPGPDQESVWDYPRPPRLEPFRERLRVAHAGQLIADTRQGFRVLETSHPPVYYFPSADVHQEFLQPASGHSFCEYKGVARYWTVDVHGERSEKAAWSYDAPTGPFLPIRGYLAFYASRVDECWVGDEKVVPQAGDFYGGWITSRIVGPFKGGPGTRGW